MKLQWVQCLEMFWKVSRTTLCSVQELQQRAMSWKYYRTEGNFCVSLYQRDTGIVHRQSHVKKLLDFRVLILSLESLSTNQTCKILYCMQDEVLNLRTFKSETLHMPVNVSCVSVSPLTLWCVTVGIDKCAKLHLFALKLQGFFYHFLVGVEQLCIKHV